MTLREYRKEDSAVIAAWIRTEEELYKWSADRYNKFPLSGDDIDRSYAPQLETGRFFPLTAVDDNGNAAGHFIIRYPREDDDSSVRFGFVVVDPALRGNGYGKEMLRLGIEYVRKYLTASRIDLGVFENNVSAKRCYQAAGFTEYASRVCALPVGTWTCTDMEMFVRQSSDGEGRPAEIQKGKAVMNQIIQSLLARKSVRAYTDQEIPEDIVEEILRASVQAPTAGNQQLYTILRISDPEKKHRLSISCDNQPFIEKAKLVLVYCADCLKWYTAYKAAGCQPRELMAGDLLLAVCDAVIAAQNAVVAAESFGIGSCYIGDIMENIEEQRDILGLPPYILPAAMLVFGYPTEQQIQRKKPERADMKYVVFENSYHELSAEELEDMFSPRTGGQDYHAWLKAFCDRKYNSAFAVEMSRSVKKYLEDFT